MIPYFIMLVGIPGSGKSRWALEILSVATAIVCPDKIRKKLTGSITDHSKELEVWTEVKEKIVSLLNQGVNVILDGTNVDSRGWQDVLKVLPECIQVAKLFEVEPEVAYERIQKDIAEKVDRSDVPEHAVYRCYGMYLYTKKLLLNSPEDYGFSRVTIIEDEEDWIRDIEGSRKMFGGHYKQET